VLPRPPSACLNSAGSVTASRPRSERRQETRLLGNDDGLKQAFRPRMRWSVQRRHARRRPVAMRACTGHASAKCVRSFLRRTTRNELARPGNGQPFLAGLSSDLVSDAACRRASPGVAMRRWYRRCIRNVSACSTSRQQGSACSPFCFPERRRSSLSASVSVSRPGASHFERRRSSAWAGAFHLGFHRLAALGAAPRGARASPLAWLRCASAPTRVSARRDLGDPCHDSAVLSLLVDDRQASDTLITPNHGRPTCARRASYTLLHE